MVSASDQRLLVELAEPERERILCKLPQERNDIFLVEVISHLFDRSPKATSLEYIGESQFSTFIELLVQDYSQSDRRTEAATLL